MDGGSGGFSRKLRTRHVIVHAHHAERRRFLARNLDARYSHVGLLGDVVGEHAAVVHLVDMVAGQDQHVVRVVGS